MPTIDDEIRSKIDSFATDLVALVRRAALAAAASALGGGPLTAPAQPAVKRGRGRPRKNPAPAPAKPAPAKAPAAPAKASKSGAGPASKAPVSKKAAAAKRAPGEKRPPGELVKLTERLGDYIKAHPGVRMEAISKALGTPTKDLTLPVKKLLAGKKIKVQGEKRATEYFPS